MISALAPAKINLSLFIKGKTESSYHEVDMIMQTVGIYDVVHLDFYENGKNEDMINISCNKNLGCNYKDNIVFKIAKKFFEFTNLKNPKIRFKIEKNIPICAGLAGGSSDGAAALLCLDKLFGTNLSKKELVYICQSVGSDIPFCLLGGTFRACGTGTTLYKLKDIPKCHILILKPNCNVSTKEAYRLYDDFGVKNMNKNIESILKSIEKKDLKAICKSLYNDFEQFIKNDKITKAKSDLYSLNPLGVCMSGSGPAVYAVFESISLAEKDFDYLKNSYKDFFICSPVSNGAKLI